MPETQIKPSDVFTPREPKVNRDMYINRKHIEERFLAALDTKHAILIHGESGNGKSWLYKEFFTDHDVFFCVVDLNTARTDGFDLALQEAYISEPTRVATKTQTKLSGGIRSVFQIAAEQSREEELIDVRTFEKLCRFVRDIAGPKTAFIVFDNLEQAISSTDVLQRLADCVIRVDNERYAEYGVRLLIVGTPGDLREIIARHGDTNTLMNRMRLLPEVGRMEESEARELLRKGFQYLGLKIEDEAVTYDKILFLTDRVAEQVHSLALEVANIAVKEGHTVDPGLVNRACSAWLSDSLLASKDQIRRLMNKKQKEVQRVDQTIFALGKINSENFTPSDVEAIIKQEFPKSVADKTGLGVGHIMKNRLSKGEAKIILQNPDSPSYRFANAKMRMAIRASMTVDQYERIIMED